jgi:hypothetical protein
MHRAKKWWLSLPLALYGADALAWGLETHVFFAQHALLLTGFLAPELRRAARPRPERASGPRPAASEAIMSRACTEGDLCPVLSRAHVGKRIGHSRERLRAAEPRERQWAAASSRFRPLAMAANDPLG